MLFGSVVVILDLWCRGALVLSIFVIILVSWESNLSEFGFKTSGKSELFSSQIHEKAVQNASQILPNPSKSRLGGGWELVRWGILSWILKKSEKVGFGMVLGGFWGPFGRSFWSKNAFFSDLFLDVFSDGLFNGFGMPLELILEVFRKPKHA